MVLGDQETLPGADVIGAEVIGSLDLGDGDALVLRGDAGEGVASLHRVVAGTVLSTLALLTRCAGLGG